MKTYKRICIKDFIISEDLTLNRGQEYITSDANHIQGHELVTVYSTFWVSNVPVEIFAGAEVFTEGA